MNDSKPFRENRFPQKISNAESCVSVKSIMVLLNMTIRREILEQKTHVFQVSYKEL